MCCSVILEGEDESGWGDRQFEVEAILARQLSEVQYFSVYVITCSYI